MAEVIRTASVQYDEMVGTAAMDDGDFEDYEKLLGLKDWVVLGVH